MANSLLPAFYSFKVADKEGALTNDANLYFDQTFQTLNSVITINGLVVPVLSAAPTNAPIGAIWYNSSIGAGKLQFQNSAGVQLITSTP